MRFLGISSLAIQTAGYSGQAVPEIRIEASTTQKNYGTNTVDGPWFPIT